MGLFSSTAERTEKIEKDWWMRGGRCVCAGKREILVTEIMLIQILGH